MSSSAISCRRAGPGRPDEEALDRRKALDTSFALRYEELRRIALSLKRDDGNDTLSATALVNEVWLKLSASPELGMLPAAHFKAIVARAMRRLLIDAARRRNARKRSGGSAVHVSFDDSVERQMTIQDNVLDLDAALCDLKRRSPRQALLVEGRYVGGLTSAELARLLEVSKATVEREWRTARDWLKSYVLCR
jgi:RNA polymerase sigma-70 factor, ECF subfamily